ncbi:MAG: MaoC family dehydratase [Natronomonas sp.]
MARYFEDIEVGSVYETGSYEMTTDEIKEFAGQYDPQPFHTNEEAAKESIFGELVASGWHTAAVCMRLLVDDYLDEETSMGARGVDELRWVNPVYPGDRIRVEVEVIERWPSESRPEMGHVRSKLVGYNQDDEPVIEWKSLAMVRRRSSGDSSDS